MTRCGVVTSSLAPICKLWKSGESRVLRPHPFKPPSAFGISPKGEKRPAINFRVLCGARFARPKRLRHCEERSSLLLVFAFSVIDCFVPRTEIIGIFDNDACGVDAFNVAPIYKLWRASCGFTSESGGLIDFNFSN